MSEGELDVVVLGATGVTGRRVAAYLAEQRPDGEGWAAAGRDAGRVGAVLAEEGVSAPETIVADVADPESLSALASRARVVLNLVGPYTPTARPVIEACVENGAHYADLTGEIPFARRMIDEFDEAAAAAAVKIVQVCGFEALPPDLLVLLATEAARERWDEGLAEADLELTWRPPGGFVRPSDLSGGTLQSLAAMVSDPDAARARDPAALIPDEGAAARVRVASPISVAPRRGAGGAVVAPMQPSGYINPAVIQRTAALIAAEAGDGFDPFRYREGLALTGSDATLPLRYVAAGAMAGPQAAFASATRARPSMRGRIAHALGTILPSSGFGPAADRLEKWTWGMSVRARTSGGHEVRTTVDADGQPGYLATARLLGEAGLLMAEPDATPDRAGCLTPATALGTDTVERFERARLRFSVAG
jgi:short subunit dehydrogenase-like uncharacterized protein